MVKKLILFGLFMTVLSCANQGEPGKQRNEFLGLFPGRWQITTDSKGIRQIYGYHITLAKELTVENVEVVTRDFLNKVKNILGINPAELKLERAANSGADRTWLVSYARVYGKYRVQGAGIKLIIKNNKIVFIENSASGRISVSTESALSPDRIMQILRRDLDTKNINIDSQQGEIVSAMGKDRFVAQLHVNADNGEKLFWYTIDQATAQILFKVADGDEDGIQGTVTAKVYVPNPHDNPQMTEMPLPGIKVYVYGGSAAQTNTQADGTYAIPGLSGMIDVGFELSSPQVLVIFHPDPAGGGIPYEVFMTYPFFKIAEVPYQNQSLAAGTTAVFNWNWWKSWVNFPSVNHKAAVNTYYHTHKIYAFFTQGGVFDVPGPLYQANVEFKPFPVKVMVGCPSNVCDGNACANSLAMKYEIADPAAHVESTAFSQDTIYHEYTHRVVHAVYGGNMYSASNINQAGKHLLQAMNEAFADYYSCSLSGDPYFGEWIYHTQSGEPLRTIENAQKYPQDFGGDVEGGSYYVDSLILSGALWDLRQSLGAAVVDELLMRVLKDNPLSYGEVLAYFFLHNDDNGDLTDGTPDFDAIYEAFYTKHGIFHPICLLKPGLVFAQLAQPQPLLPETELNAYGKTVSTVKITGYLSATSLMPDQSYVIEYAIQNEPDVWVTQGITLKPQTDWTTAANYWESNEPFYLADWDISGLENGFYTLRLRVNAPQGAVVSEAEVYIHKEMESGWPKVLTSYHAPVAVDLDLSYAGKELVLNTYGKEYAWHADGSALSGWPLTRSTNMSCVAAAVLAAGEDLQCVIGAASGGPYLFNWQGYAGQAAGALGDNTYYPTVADLDGDGDLEIICGSQQNQVYVWHHNGELDSHWPQSVGGAVISSPAVCDLDGQAGWEIVAAAKDGKVYAWHADGSVVAGAWPVTVGPSWILCSPVLGNIDGDAGNTLEVVIASRNQTICVYDKEGAMLPGWPQDAGAMVDASPALADLDNNGDLEIIVVTFSGQVLVFKHNGEPFNGSWSFTIPGTGNKNCVPLVGDVDNDAVPEILLGGLGGYIYALHPDGSPAADWPKQVFGDVKSLCLENIDSDPNMEVVVVTSAGFFVLELDFPYNPASVLWPCFQKDYRRSGLY